MRASLMASLLLLLLACTPWACAAQSQHAVRLCGRELIRAVVYTCGGSRWRRNQSEFTTNDAEMDGAQSFGVAKETKQIRSLATEMSAKCCKMGCSKRDLTLLC